MSLAARFIEEFIEQMNNCIGSIRFGHDKEDLSDSRAINHFILGKDGFTGFQRFLVFVDLLFPVSGIVTANVAVEDGSETFGTLRSMNISHGKQWLDEMVGHHEKAAECRTHLPQGQVSGRTHCCRRVVRKSDEGRCSGLAVAIHRKM